MRPFLFLIILSLASPAHASICGFVANMENMGKLLAAIEDLTWMRAKYTHKQIAEFISQRVGTKLTTDNVLDLTEHLPDVTLQLAHLGLRAEAKSEAEKPASSPKAAPPAKPAPVRASVPTSVPAFPMNRISDLHEILADLKAKGTEGMSKEAIEDVIKKAVGVDFDLPLARVEGLVKSDPVASANLKAVTAPLNKKPPVVISDRVINTAELYMKSNQPNLDYVIDNISPLYVELTNKPDLRPTPRQYEALLFLIQARRMRGDLAIAESMISVALEHKPPQTIVNRLGEETFQLARVMYGRSPTKPANALKLLTPIYEELKRPERSSSISGSEYKNMRLLIEIMRKSGEISEAIELTRFLLTRAVSPEQTGFLNGLLQDMALGAGGKPDDVITVLRPLPVEIQQRPQTTPLSRKEYKSILALSMALRTKGLYAEASIAIRTALEREQDPSKIIKLQFELSLTLESQPGKLDEAIDALSAAHFINSNIPAVNFRLAELLVVRDSRKPSQQDLEDALKLYRVCESQQELSLLIKYKIDGVHKKLATRYGRTDLRYLPDEVHALHRSELQGPADRLIWSFTHSEPLGFSDGDNSAKGREDGGVAAQDQSKDGPQ